VDSEAEFGPDDDFEMEIGGKPDDEAALDMRNRPPEDNYYEKEQDNLFIGHQEAQLISSHHSSISFTKPILRVRCV
jgi:hypothetical protein